MKVFFFLLLFVTYQYIELRAQNVSDTETAIGKEGIFAQVSLGTGYSAMAQTIHGEIPELGKRIDYKSDLSNISYSAKLGWSVDKAIFFLSVLGTRTYHVKTILPKGIETPDTNETIEYSLQGWSPGFLFYYPRTPLYTGIEYRFLRASISGVDPKNPKSLANYDYNGTGYSLSFGSEWAIASNWYMGVGVFYARDTFRRDGSVVDHPYFGTQVTLSYY